MLSEKLGDEYRVEPGMTVFLAGEFKFTNQDLPVRFRRCITFNLLALVIPDSIGRLRGPAAPGGPTHRAVRRIGDLLK